MPQSDFAYTCAERIGGAPSLSVSIFADRAHIREEMRGDVAAAGMAVRECEPIGALLGDGQRSIGEVVLVDCPQVDGGVLAALSRLDLRARHSGAQLLVSTSIEALDEVFACCDQSGAQILVDAGRAERLVSLGRALTRFSNLRLRELSQDDRLTLLRLTEQMEEIAQRLDNLGAGHASIIGDGKAFRFESPVSGFNRADDDTGDGDRLVRRGRPSLPDSRMVRRIIRHRQMRGRFFDGALFADPAWDILLDLTAARVEHTRVSVTSLCIASGVPPTTALRWIGQMTESGLLERVEDESDRRRVFIALSDRASDMMARYFAEVGAGAAELV